MYKHDKKPVSDNAQKIIQQDIFNSDILDVSEQQIRWIYDKQNFISDFIQIQDTFWTQASEVIDDRYAEIYPILNNLYIYLKVIDNIQLHDMFKTKSSDNISDIDYKKHIESISYQFFSIQR